MKIFQDMQVVQHRNELLRRRIFQNIVRDTEAECLKNRFIILINGQDKLHIMENYIYDDKIKDVVKSEEQVDLFGIRGVMKIVDYQEEAFEFLSWLCGEEGAQIIAGSGNISGYMNDEIQEIYRDSLQGKNADVFFKSQRVLESPPRPEYNEMLGAFTDIAEEYLLQNITFEEAEAKLEAKRQELYAR